MKIVCRKCLLAEIDLQEDVHIITHTWMFTLIEKKESEVNQLCLTLCDPMGCSLPGTSVHGIFQARVLEWGAIALQSR